MPGIKALRKVQWGKETTAGTPVAATTIWRGEGTHKDENEVIFPAEDVGIIGGTTRSYVARYWSEMSLPSVEATFEQLPYIFEAGVAAETATADGTGSGYLYNYLAPTTAQNTINTYTVEAGDDVGAEEFDYAFVKSFTLSGEGQGALMVSSEWFGRQASTTTFTTTAIPTVEEILVNSATLYIDAGGGTIGTTPVSNLLYGLSLAWTTGQIEYWAVDSSLDFSATKNVADEIVLNMTYEHDTNAMAEKVAYKANTVRLIRLKFEGTALTTSGVYSNKTLIIDVAGVYEDWSALGDRDGNDVVEATLRVRYSDTDSLKADVTFVNELAALP